MNRAIAFLRSIILFPLNILMGAGSSDAVPAQGTMLHIEGNAGGAKTITGVTVGFPTIITSAAHGLSNGDYVTFADLAGADAALLNGKGFTVTNKTTNTFAVQVDTSGKTITAGTGTATPLEWIEVGMITNIRGTADTSPDIKTTTLKSQTEEYIQGLPDTGGVTCDMLHADSDAGLLAMEAAHDARVSKAFKITYSKGATPVRAFTGFVKSYPKIGDASAGGVVTGSIELKRSGVVTKA